MKARSNPGPEPPPAHQSIRRLGTLRLSFSALPPVPTHVEVPSMNLPRVQQAAADQADRDVADGDPARLPHRLSPAAKRLHDLGIRPDVPGIGQALGTEVHQVRESAQGSQLRLAPTRRAEGLYQDIATLGLVTLAGEQVLHLLRGQPDRGIGERNG